MYEYMTFEVILQRMLDKVPNTVDKREGSVIYDALAPAALELALMYIEADVILNETFADTASRQYLIKRAAERGLKPDEATKAILKGEFSMNVPISSRYSLDDLNYVVTEKISDGIFKLECETAGRVGNSYFGNLIPIDYIAGLQTAKITELLIPGEDEEDTEVFRQQYLNSFDNQAYGGNIADYKEKTKEIQGVGGVKVYPVWNGGGTVKLIIINSEWQMPAPEMLDTVQTIIDPIPNQGQGLGVAPIGHIVTVEGVTSQSVNLELQLAFQDDFDFASMKGTIEEVVDAYFLELNKKWADNKNTIIRTSQIESRLLELTEIIDVQHTKINGIEENFTLAPDAIAVRGEVSATG
jgi:uncharacterized phage protein gp47/JayE